jgi:hypothetical protein
MRCSGAIRAHLMRLAVELSEIACHVHLVAPVAYRLNRIVSSHEPHMSRPLTGVIRYTARIREEHARICEDLVCLRKSQTTLAQQP